jgi:hypothetical protein
MELMLVLIPVLKNGGEYKNAVLGSLSRELEKFWQVLFFTSRGNYTKV